jgi:hypothetical protein
MWLMSALRQVGTKEQIAALADRAIINVAIDDPEAVAFLLREIGAAEKKQQEEDLR